MEVLNSQQVENCPVSTVTDVLHVSGNWKVVVNDDLHKVITVQPSSKESETFELEDAVSMEKCVAVQQTDIDVPFLLNIKVKNCQRVSRIVVVSQGYVLEFFKEYGEYASTIFAEMIDEFAGHQVFVADTKIGPPTSETDIKFTKVATTDSLLWIYGIKIYLTEQQPENVDNGFSNMGFGEIFLNYVSKVYLENEKNNTPNNANKKNENKLKPSNHVAFQHDNNQKNEDAASCSQKQSTSNVTDIASYIDNKFNDMETRLTRRIDELEERTNEKLDKLLKLLESQHSTK